MKKKQYKVRFENGKIIPLEPTDLNEIKEGILYWKESLKENPNQPDLKKKLEEIEKENP